MNELLDKLNREHSLREEEYLTLVKSFSKDISEYAAYLARKAVVPVYGNKIYIRGLIEISNICKNDCLYCGIRRSNKNADRYRLTKEEILECCDEGYSIGFRTFVMQGGEDAYFNDTVVCDIVREIKNRYPDTAVTLSLGERSYESYEALKEAGADRYLLRHETASSDHYKKLHPKELSFENRMRCLKDLKSLGFQTGCGFMVQSPCQTAENLAKDLKFIEDFSPQMCGIGPFIPHTDTPFKDEAAGSAELTCYLLSIIRIMKPNILLPATTALGSIIEDGRLKGIMAGANVMMPNLSPSSVRKKYSLYNNKLHTGAEAAEALEELKKQVSSIGYEIVSDRGNYKEI